MILGLGLSVAAQGQGGGGVDPFGPRSGGGATAAARPAAANQMRSAEFVDTPITDVLRVVSDLTGWSIVMSPAVSKEPPRVNLWAKDMAPSEVLRQVVSLSGLVLHREGAAYHVMTFDEYARQFGIERAVRVLEHVSAEDVAGVLAPFIASAEAAKVVPVRSVNQVVLLAPQPLMGDLQRLIDAIDVPLARDQVRVIRLTHLRAGEVVPELEKLLGNGSGAGRLGVGRVVDRPTEAAAGEGQAGEAGEAVVEDGAGGRAGEGLAVQFMVEPRLNAVVLRGVAGDVKRASGLLAELDQPAGREVVSYELRHVDAAEVFAALEDLLAEDSSGAEARGSSGVRGSGGELSLAVSEQNNRVVVEGTAEQQARVARMVAAIDQPLPAGAGEIRVYRLENATAEEVVEVLTRMVEEREASAEGPKQRPGFDEPGRPGGGDGWGMGGQGQGAGSERGVNRIGPMADSLAGGASRLGTTEGGDEGVASAGQAPPRVTAAAEINAVVVRASAVEHETLGRVIAELDLPRDQVLLEVTLVSVSSSDEFRLGVELGGSNFGTIGTLGFTSFGIGQVNAGNGNISVSPTAPFGLNFSIFNGDDLTLVLNALRSVGDTRISSAPKLLVADNSPGEIRQISEEPFTTASQSDSSTITSFGGFVEAGTTVKVVPHISKQDWLRLDYEIELSSFQPRNAQQLAANIPPPRTVNHTSGTVRVPAGYVVALGGLVSKRDDETVDGVPVLSELPVLGELFKNRRQAQAYSTLYIFLRPVILRDPGFRDLLLLSEDDVREAGIGDERYPSNPLKLIVPAGRWSEAWGGGEGSAEDPGSLGEGGGQ